MIKLEQPSLAINTFDVPGPNYRMDKTVKLTEYANAIYLTDQIKLAATGSAGAHLENVVINCHGGPGYLYISSTTTKNKDDFGQRQKEINVRGIGIEDVGLFKKVKGQIGTIWIVGCQVAGATGINRRSGDNFCSQLAVIANCNVVAANVSQIISPLRILPKNCIDDYEGTVYRWDANGKREVFKQGKKI